MSAERQYFPYIDGLRALSIIAVVLFHLDPALLPGGFGGVDIFFVVSGFIVSGSLHGHKATSFLALAGLFYARRLRRIAPALLFMLTVTTLAVAIFIPEAFLSLSIRQTAIPAFFGLSNIRLGMGVDYFSTLAEFNPFTHTWSLGVEEQFYLIFPGMFFLLTRGGRTATVSALALAALCVASFAYGFVEPRLRFNLGFYSSLARFWEIGAGVLLYVVLARYGLFERQATPRRELQIATWPGVVLVAAGLVAGLAPAYPVPGALLPVGGALLLILGLQGREPLSPIGRLLSSRTAVAIGLISYSLYLWHWPVFALFRWTAGFSTPAQKLSALAVAVALSLVSYFLVEKPLRLTQRLRVPARAITVYVLAAVVLAVAADRMLGNTQLISASTVNANRADWYPSGARGAREQTGCRVVWDRRPIARGHVEVTRRENCDGADAPHRLIVVGDSHALAYAAMLADYTRQTGVPVLMYQYPDCAFMHLVPSAARALCADRLAVVLDALDRELKAGDVVFLSSLRVPRFRYQWSDDDLDTKALWSSAVASSEAGFTEAIAILERLHKPDVRFVFELPKPIFATPLFRCADWFNRNNPGCSRGTETPRAEMEKYRRPVLDFAERLQASTTNFSTWDPLPVLCPGATCAMMRDGKPLFFDGDHVSGFANRLLLADFMKKMAELGLPRR